jgi:hypothetical protein
MTVRHEIKSQLAKLLATEDLVVEHKKVETAQFNVHTRVLTLPMWEKASNTVYDLLVGHEVGHALYTPDEDWTVNVKVPPQFVNIVEDARSEKMMKRRYPGLAKTSLMVIKNSLTMISFKSKTTILKLITWLTVQTCGLRLVTMLMYRLNVVKRLKLSI